MASRVVWRGPEVARRVEAEYRRRINKCCTLVFNKAHGLLSVNGTGKRAKGITVVLKGGARKRLRKGTLIYGANPSAPGEPPHLQTGRLRASVQIAVTGLVGRVGTNLDVGRWLELGTRLTEARPWLRPALLACLPEIRAILSAPMTS